MATAKKIVKISDKMNKVSDSFTVHRFDNGYMIEISGQNGDDWLTAKVVCTNLEDLYVLIKEAVTLPTE